MKVFSLLGLRNVQGVAVRLDGAPDGSLYLPPWLAADERLEIMAFYQGACAERPLPRLEVDWMGGILPTDQRLLANHLRRHGAGEVVLVVQMSEGTADFAAVDADPLVTAFRHVAVLGCGNVTNERLGRLGALARATDEALEAAYFGLVGELGLRRDGPDLLRPLVETLLSPVQVVAAWNALVDVQAQVRRADDQRKAIYHRVLGGLVDGLDAKERLALLAAARAKAEDLPPVLRNADFTRARERLQRRLLLRDGAVQRWGRMVADPQFEHVGRSRLHSSAVNDQHGAAVLKLWDNATKGESRLHKRVFRAYSLHSGGRIDAAKAHLEALASQILRPGTPPLLRGDFVELAGRIAESEGQSSAEGLYREAIDLLRDGGADPGRIGVAYDDLARLLRNNGRWAEAEPLLREALRLAEEGGESPTSRGDTMRKLALGLRDNDRWAEAEPLFREALRLAEEGGDGPTSRGPMMRELACGLRDNGSWSEAEPLFRKVLRLMEEGGDSPTSRGITMHELARGLRDNGRWAEAEPLFREALQLREEGGGTPASRSDTMVALARGLRDNGRWAEAEALFRTALRLQEEDGASPTSRGVTLHNFAIGLRDNGRWAEAEPMFRESLRLAEEGGDTSTSRGITRQELAHGLRDNGRWAEAEPLYREALRLKEAGGAKPASIALTMNALAKGLREAGNLVEADEWQRRAARLQARG